MGRDALRWHQAVLAWEPNDRGMLRRTGLLAERFNRDELALTCWRRLLAGLPRGSFDWFEARYHQIAILARRDADRAEDVLKQHASLYPEYGVEPWGSRLRALHERLVGRADSPIPREGEDEQGGQP
jgi:hypothetical protein